MRFSVIIPAYNARTYIHEALDSLMAQTFDDFEVICIDDGSTDDTLSLLETYAGDHANVTVLHEENSGPLLARRRGMRSAEGEYVMFLDADDRMRSDALEIVSRAIDETDADVVSFLHSRMRDFVCQKQARDLLNPGLYSGNRYHDVRLHLSRGRFNTLSSKSIRLSRIDLLESYDPYKGLKHGEDWFQLIPIIDSCKSLYQLPEALYYYRPNNGSGTATFKPSQVDDIAIVHRRFLEYARKWGSDCYCLACGGETIQYINLLKISELSNASDEEKKANFRLISSAMQSEGTFDRCSEADLRPDNRVIAWGLAHDNRALALAVIRAVEVMKR